LIDVAQDCQGIGEVREHLIFSVGIFGDPRTEVAMRRICEAMTPLQKRTGSNEVPEVEADQPV
jgi:hypothetical protein